jgi:hypothetical protein
MAGEKAGVVAQVNTYSHFNVGKIIQTLAYIQRKTGADSKTDLIKYLFFADRVNIRRYFSSISQDYYYALKLGPIASETLDVLNKDEEYLNYPDDVLQLLEKISIKDKQTRIIDEASLDLLSKNEIESIDFVTNIFKKDMPLIEFTHEYPEWKRYGILFKNKYISKVNINVEDFFKNPDMDNSPLLKKYFSEDPLYEDLDYLNEAKRFYLEKAALVNDPF